MSPKGLCERFSAALAELRGSVSEGPILVALSGGLDSCVLLHMLRFGITPRPDIIVAHFDHRMRPDSTQDAEWARGLCAAWEIPISVERAAHIPTSEEAARDARYVALESVQQRVGATHLLTGHHADDQAETVLFRVLRGTGIDGLRGIPASRSPGVLRPLLGFWRTELEAYARSVGLRWREDSTNKHVGYARNVIRRELIPRVEEAVAPGARTALVRLAAIAEGNEAAWAVVLPGLIAGLDLRPQERSTSEFPGLSWSRPRMIELHPALRAKTLRRLAADAGVVLGESGTRRAVDFVSSSRSGSRLELGRGFELRRELDRFVLRRTGAEREDRPLRIADLGPGSGEAVVGGRILQVRWGADRQTSAEDEGTFPIEVLEFPLTVRGRAPGDRIRLRGHSRKVKALLLEARIPSGMRSQVPILADGAGRILWVQGVAVASEVPTRQGERTWGIRIG
ncbi:MAG: tRNA lysidine(34) synthetase TilS [Gemmatimonadetes bacterium]|nr:tRNA lysidine(34) synthetase TilS [Gemmatimonadota bacterium]MDA1104663.1 tRNA lysidine(34) synthetase TilS [Gemmatimonadota bacterium]